MTIYQFYHYNKSYLQVIIRDDKFLMEIDNQINQNYFSKLL